MQVKGIAAHGRIRAAGDFTGGPHRARRDRSQALPRPPSRASGTPNNDGEGKGERHIDSGRLREHKLPVLNEELLVVVADEIGTGSIGAVQRDGNRAPQIIAIVAPR